MPRIAIPITSPKTIPITVPRFRPLSFFPLGAAEESNVRGIAAIAGGDIGAETFGLEDDEEGTGHTFFVCSPHKLTLPENESQF